MTNPATINEAAVKALGFTVRTECEATGMVLAPAGVNLALGLLDGTGWTLERLLKFLRDDADLFRRDLYRGNSVRVTIFDHAGREQVAYIVTATYTKGQQWRVA